MQKPLTCTWSRVLVGFGLAAAFISLVTIDVAATARAEVSFFAFFGSNNCSL